MTKFTPITTAKKIEMVWTKRSNLPIRTICEGISPGKRKKGEDRKDLDWNRINYIVRV